MSKDDTPEKFRVDKWLFATRFFKTRTLAAEAIDRGKIHLNGIRIKPAKTVSIGDMLKIRIGHYEYEVEIMALSNKRFSAPQAQKLYRETEPSRRQREVITEQLKMLPPGFYTKGRPTKRDRRDIERFKNKE